MIRSENGYFGRFGGSYVPEILHETIHELTSVYESARADPAFWEHYKDLLSTYSCRPTPLTHADSLSEKFGGAQIYIKREDLNHTGAHKLNNVLGQGLLAKRMGKPRVIAETGAGQHGVATATMAAKLGLECTVYMGAVDIERQYPNVFWMRKMGAEVVAVTSGSKTLKDAINEAMKDWATNMDNSHYVLGSACGPHPFPEMVSWFQSLTGLEIREQILKVTGRLPRAIYACVGGGSNALGAMSPFIDDKDVELVGVEAGGEGLKTGKHAARISSGECSIGVAQGYKSYFLQDGDGQMRHTHSIAAGIDYIGVSPIIAYLTDIGRMRCEAATDVEVLDAVKQCMKSEGLIPALESAHGFAVAFKEAARFDKDDSIVVNLSGRGDKDIFNFAGAFQDVEWTEFLERKLTEMKGLA
jgi:tryptophan synthase beta chain